VDVKITLFDRNSEKVFDEAKTLNLIKEETNVALNFRELKSGFHFIIIQVIDKVTTEVDVFSRNIKF
jgi:hypothetical protein